MQNDSWKGTVAFIVIFLGSWLVYGKLHERALRPSSPPKIDDSTAQLLNQYQTGSPKDRLTAFQALYKNTSLHDLMVPILQEEGDRELAEAFLNASVEFSLARGAKLEKAGREWANAHNCQVIVVLKNHSPSHYSVGPPGSQEK